jgi:cbb3-type cytochrome oxidase subunit 3
MGLRDVVGNMGNTFLVEVALVLFFVVFVAIVVYVFLRRRSHWDKISRIPLNDDPAADPEKGKS